MFLVARQSSASGKLTPKRLARSLALLAEVHPAGYKQVRFLPLVISVLFFFAQSAQHHRLSTTLQQPHLYQQQKPNPTPPIMSQDAVIWEVGKERHERVARIPDGYQKETEWLPIYYRRTPYNEDEIVHLINEIVRNYIRLSSITPESVIWPPEGGHRLNVSLLDEMHVSPAARSLISRLPSPSGVDLALYGESRMWDVTDEEGLRESRKRLMGYDEQETATGSERLVLPQDVQLTWGPPQSAIVFLDTEENTIRVEDQFDGPEVVNPPGTHKERPDNPYHYRNFWPMHAPTWLRMRLHKIRTLETIPPGGGVHSGAYLDFGQEWLRRRIKHTLEGTFGWPDEFLQEEWDRDRDDVWEKAVQEWDKLGHPALLLCE
ncbi:hypothetical protein CJF31_00009317 [Rutstroemia sp. NJR-2017a BVV2]|nr:hypothetical protein CJF31_00009317 [Rutstroemia sp. NJR-2017a BVV2]